MKHPSGQLSLLALGATLAVSPAALADTLVKLDPTAVYGPNYSYSADSAANVGYEFTVGRANVTIRSLGYFDAPNDYHTPANAGDGLLSTDLVGIYDTSGNLLTSATIAAGTAAPLRDGFRWATIAPITLLAGHTYVADAAPSTGVDAWAYLYGAVDMTDVDPSLSITYPASRYTYAGAGLVFPTGTIGYYSYLGPSMATDVVASGVPDGGATFCLMGFGLGMLGLLRRKLAA